MKAQHDLLCLDGPLSGQYYLASSGGFRCLEPKKLEPKRYCNSDIDCPVSPVDIKFFEYKINSLSTGDGGGKDWNYWSIDSHNLNAVEIINKLNRLEGR